ncbi:MAG: EcsC family protein [Tissierellia bacterium]|nr:EcsC family protein [Tissierellia bacterium]
MKRELKKQLRRLYKKEEKLLNRREIGIVRNKVSPIVGRIQDKIPGKLKDTLEDAFYIGFKLVFEKGHKYIEKTYDKDKLKLEHDLNNYMLEINSNRKNFKSLDKKAKSSKNINSAISILEGGVLGVLGIGLPDIPLFISIVIKTIYEIALSYGYDYNKDEEKAYILLLISTSLSKGDRKKELNEKVDILARQIDKGNNIEIDLQNYIKIASCTLSNAMLTAKFIQGIPIVGAVGGLVNYSIIRKIGNYSSLKYKKRYLMKKARKDLL